MSPSVDGAGSPARVAAEVAAAWGLELGDPFRLALHSFVAPAGGSAVLKVTPAEDDEADEEADALALWAGCGAVRLLRHDRSRRALLLERAVPGSDIAGLPEGQATEIAVEVASRLWRPGVAAFRWVGDHVPAWLDAAERERRPGFAPLVAHARRLVASMEIGRDVVVHGDLHHHNILDAGDRHVAIDPKPMLGEPEYDVASFLWNPLGSRMRLDVTMRRLQAFAEIGLDDQRMRAWAVVRGACLRHAPHEAAVLGALL